jgi:hypothetical protein
MTRDRGVIGMMIDYSHFDQDNPSRLDSLPQKTRACPQLRRMIAETSWTAARKFRASLS